MVFHLDLQMPYVVFYSDTDYCKYKKIDDKIEERDRKRERRSEWDSVGQPVSFMLENS